MGPQPVELRAVFDSNVVISALVFRAGRVAWLRSTWSAGLVVPVVSNKTVKELLRASEDVGRVAAECA